MNFDQQMEVGGFQRAPMEEPQSQDNDVFVPGGIDESRLIDIDERALDAKQPEIKPTKTKRNYTLQAEELVNEPHALPHLFKQFTINPTTIRSLQGKGHESSDLKRIDRVFRGWHLSVNPKNEYYYFLEKVRKLGKDHEVVNYMKKLRSHYKGDDLLEEFAQDMQ